MSTENTITTAAADVAAAPNATLDELVGTTTNTAILPEPDAHAYDEIATGDADPLILGGHKFTSRFILGSGRYDLNLIKATIENAGTQIVTMALRRCRTTENNLLDYIPKGITMLPNTSGARNAEEAVRIARSYARTQGGKRRWHPPAWLWAVWGAAACGLVWLLAALL